MFEQISESFRLAVSKIRFVDDEKALNNALDVLKKALLKADVHHKVTKELLTLIEADLKQSGIGQKQFLDAKFDEGFNRAGQSRLCLCASSSYDRANGWLAG